MAGRTDTAYIEGQRRAKVRRRRRHLDEAREIVRRAKDCPCADCGQSYPHYVMDFDHVGSEKLFNIGAAVKGNMSVVRQVALVEEIAKCEVVCSNCHRERQFGG